MTRAKCFHGVRAFSTCLVMLSALLFTGQPFAAKTALPTWHVFVGQFIESYLGMHPSFASNAGRHEFDGKLPDWSPTVENGFQ